MHAGTDTTEPEAAASTIDCSEVVHADPDVAGGAGGGVAVGEGVGVGVSGVGVGLGVAVGVSCTLVPYTMNRVCAVARTTAAASVWLPDRVVAGTVQFSVNVPLPLVRTRAIERPSNSTDPLRCFGKPDPLTVIDVLAATVDAETCRLAPAALAVTVTASSPPATRQTVASTTSIEREFIWRDPSWLGTATGRANLSGEGVMAITRSVGSLAISSETHGFASPPHDGFALFV
jgi:hypothetical protein